MITLSAMSLSLGLIHLPTHWNLPFHFIETALAKDNNVKIVKYNRYFYAFLTTALDNIATFCPH